MTAKVRTLLGVVVVGATCALGGVARGETSAAQWAAIADDICTGVPAKEREMGLLAYRDNIVSVTPLNEFRFAGKAKYSHTEGAIIRLRATPGLTVPWIERVNGCHVAMAGAGRLTGSEVAMDPFVLQGTSVGASETYAGFTLSVRGTSVEAVQEILHRSYALRSPPVKGPATAALESR
jgi:hypothetical protein